MRIKVINIESKNPTKPDFSNLVVNEIILKYYNLRGDVAELLSYKDQNFHIKCESREYVFKISAMDEIKESLEFQNAGMDFLLRKLFIIPKIIPSRNGDEIISIRHKNSKYYVRMFDYLPGVIMYDFKPHSLKLYFEYGRFLGKLTRALKGFRHANIKGVGSWDMYESDKLIMKYLGHVATEEKKKIIENFLKEFNRNSKPIFPKLPKSIIHGDCNDNNIILNYQKGENYTFGLIDFEDLNYSCTIFELAIAIAYLIMSKETPLLIMMKIIEGYNSITSIKKMELSILFNLIIIRICTSVSASAYFQSLHPENEYLRITEKPGWEILNKLIKIDPTFAHYCFEYCTKNQIIDQDVSEKGWLTENQYKFLMSYQFDIDLID